MKPRLAIMSRYDRLGASSRLRQLQFVETCRAAGLQVEVMSYFDDAYLTDLYAGRIRPRDILRYFLRRCGDFAPARRADVVWLQKEALPWVPWGLERLMLGAVPIVSDFDDAVFHRYDMHRSRIVRWLLGRKIDKLMASSTIVFAGNDYLAARARAAGARRVEIIPTVVDVEAYGIAQEHHGGLPRIGWIGTPGTWRAFGVPMMAMLRDVMSRGAAEFHAVGAAKPEHPIPGFTFHDWSEETEVARIQQMDIGIMPLPDSPWARGKCGYKLIQYMACGLPVVALPVGVNRQIVEHGVNGFLAETDDEWREALATLVADPDLRRRMGAAGRKKVEADYSLQVYGPKVAAMLRDVAQAGRRQRALR